MKNNFFYYMPTKIVYGVNELHNINKFINGRKTLLLTSPFFIKSGLITKLKTISCDIVEVISEVKSHPEFKDLKDIYNKVVGIDFELIVAIGGGSTLDTAKFISVQNEKKEYKFVEDIAKNKTPKQNYKIIPIIAIPTTAGTGSEVTPWASIWDSDEKKKYSLSLPGLFSECVIYDPILTLSVPQNITIQTGLDALSHALESIWNKNANPITINYAIQSIKIIIDNIVKLSYNLSNLEYRDNMMKACMYAGLAFSNTQTAMAHGISYYITINKQVPHGIACSFTLPMLIDSIIGKYTYIDKALIDSMGELSSKKIRDILEELDISINFHDYGISEKELRKIILSLANEQRIMNSIVTVNDVFENNIEINYRKIKRT